LHFRPFPFFGAFSFLYQIPQPVSARCFFLAASRELEAPTQQSICRRINLRKPTASPYLTTSHFLNHATPPTSTIFLFLLAPASSGEPGQFLEAMNKHEFNEKVNY
jgi:hypothetical protein